MKAIVLTSFASICASGVAPTCLLKRRQAPCMPRILAQVAISAEALDKLSTDWCLPHSSLVFGAYWTSPGVLPIEDPGSMCRRSSGNAGRRLEDFFGLVEASASALASGRTPLRPPALAIDTPATCASC
jgi:hypothetical protein